jgi:hypothetical protein
VKTDKKPAAVDSRLWTFVTFVTFVYTPGTGQKWLAVDFGAFRKDGVFTHGEYAALSWNSH